MSTKKSPPVAAAKKATPKKAAAPDGREAALKRLKAAEEAVGSTLKLFGGEKTPEEKAAFEAAVQELADATAEARKFGATDGDALAETARKDLAKRFGGKA